MDNFKVTPTQNGVKAPTIFVEAKDYKEAEILARKESGLGRFKEWYFTTVKYKKKESKQNSRKKEF